MKRLLAIFLGVWILQAMPAVAQEGSNQQARDLALRLGRELSAEGLDTILNSRNQELFEQYARGMGETGMRRYTERGNKVSPVPGDVEAVMLRRYSDPASRRWLPRLCASNGFACHSRPLFDAMLAEMRQNPRSGDTYLRDAVVKSQAPGAEAALIDWLGASDAPTGDFLNSIVSHLGFQKNAAAVPAMAALLARSAPGKGIGQGSLGMIGTPAAAEALLQRLEALKRAPPSAEVTEEAKRIASSLTQFNVAVPIPYARLRATFPDIAREHALTWIGQRKDLAALPDALVLLTESATYPRALDAIVASDSPEAWKQARAAIEKGKQDGKIAENQYRYAAPLLDRKIGDPSKHFAEQKSFQQDREYSTHSGLLQRDLSEARKLRDSNPQAYVAAVREYIAAMEKLAAGYPGSMPAKAALANLREDYLALGHYVRFRQKKPQDALELYAAAKSRDAQLAQLAIADTYQYDLRDTQKALAEYRKMVDPVPADAILIDEMIFKDWAQRWLAAQIDYLSTGRKFSGKMKANDTSIPMLLLGAGASQNDEFGLAPLAQRAQGSGKSLDRAEVERTLAALPPSTFAFQASVRYASFLPDARAILAYLARQDPAGFATASYFALLEIAERKPEAAGYLAMLAPGMGTGGSDPMREARARFMAERRIDTKALHATEKADARMSSPQKTWDLFMGSLRKGDLATAMSCLTPQMQQRFKPLFSKMSPTELRAAADSFKTFQLTGGYGEFQEAIVGKTDGHGGSVTFIHTGGSWKITEM